MSRGGLVQARLTTRVAGVQLGLEHFLDQLVVAVLAGLRIDDCDEQMGVEQRFEDARVLVAGQSGACGERQLVEHGGREHEVDDVRGLSIEHLLEEVTGYRPAVHLGTVDRGASGRRAHGERGHLQTSRPAFGPPLHGLDVLLRQREPESREESVCLVEREGQVPITELHELLLRRACVAAVMVDRRERR